MMLQEKNILKFIIFTPLILIPIVVIVVVFIFFVSNQNHFQEMINNIQKELIISEEKKLQVKVDSVVELVRYRNVLVQDDNIAISDDRILGAIEKIGALGRSYIFIINEQSHFLLNTSLPKPHNISLLDSDDANVQYVSKKIHNLLAQRESGFIEYEWINVATQKKELKHSYIHRVKKDSWIVGSGFYDSQIQETVQLQKKSILDTYDKQRRYLLILGVFFILLSLLISFNFYLYIKKVLQRYEMDILAKQNALIKLNKNLEDKVQERTQELNESTKKLKELAHKDALTSIENRYSIMKRLEREIKEQKYAKSSLCVVMYDIDHFKEINDTYGHDVGDDILIALTQLIKENCRQSDFFGRYGGEEFLIIMPKTSKDEARDFAQRIRLIVQDHSFATIKELRISLGLIKYREHEDLKELFKRLDLLLYEAKKGGRNRLSCDEGE